ncbi:MAG TPA: zinc-dependent metalloprotease [Phenylobacterium sp.]
MASRLAAIVLAALSIGVSACPASAQERPQAAERAGGAPEPKSFAAVTGRLTAQKGLLPTWFDKTAGRVLMQLPPPDAEGISGRFIYQASLSGGFGSTPLGLDRAETGRSQVIVFRRVGRKVLLQAENYAFRADGGTEDEKVAVRKSFAISTLWAADVEAEAPDGGAVVDLTGFLTRDALDVGGALRQRKQGTYRIAPALTYVDVAASGVFPENLEFETDQTFTSDEPGPEVRAVTPDAHAVTLIVHHSFVKLPDPGFEPRLWDPRTGTSVQVLVNNYAAPLDAQIVTRLVRRFRLEKTDPSAARSPVKKPIVFYVDRAAPEPVRSALVEGAGWWAKAFEAAGFESAFRVEVLPAGVNPMDARYNVINWIHRQTRGWSTGQTIVDPRTGEIVRGVVQLGSLRIRQDKLIFEGLAGADKTGKGGADDPVQLSLARIRQLGMHETGHALGFSHNFAGSTFGDRASAMDYPAPLIRVKGQALDFSDVYAKGPGDWDRFTVRWLYSQFPKGVDERKALDAMAKAAEDKGMRFIADDEHPASTQWDNGDDPVAGLENVMAVRRLALDRFGLRNIAQGEPVADLRRVFVPIYLFHRYEVDAAVKALGGVDYSYAVRGDGHEAAKVIPAAEQRRALAALLKTLAPAELDLPDGLIALLSEGHSGTPDRQFDIEVFPSMGGPVFDLPGAATLAADMTLSQLVEPARLNRMVEQKRRDPTQLGVSEMLTTVLAALAPGAPGGEGRYAEIRRRERMRLIGDVVDSLEDKTLSPTAAGELRAALTRLGQQLATISGGDEEAAQGKYLSRILTEQDPERLAALATGRQAAAKLPPGAPIEDCWFCMPVSPTGAEAAPAF